MLSDRDRERLREIQRQFMTEDPDFVREFAARPPQQPVAKEPNPDVYTVLIVSVTAVSVLTLLAGWLASALMFAFLAVLIWTAHHRARDHHKTPGV